MALIDVFNDRYEPIGAEDKRTAHAKGMWHRTFSALAVNPATRRVILQKKAPGRYGFDRPDYADITVGGHYQAGETVPDGVREVPRSWGYPWRTVTCTRSACGRPRSPSPPATSSASSGTGT